MLKVLNLPAPIDRLLPIIVKPIASIPPLARFLSRKMINQFGYATTLRPRPLSLASDYTSWLSLTDKTFSGRHLPPSSPEYQAGLPSEADVTALFRREQEVLSTDTTVAFVFFAQWFTDSFLRTDLNDFRKNESNHEIDMCQIYGRTIAQTDLLRSGVGGHLKSQLIDGEEFPAFLFQSRASGGPLVFKAEFDGLFDPAFITDVILGGAADERKDSFFAVGLEHGNSTIGSTMLNIVFIREHNRLADMLATDNPDWDDERLFQTARNIVIVLLLKLVVEEYIEHIGPWDTPIELVPFIADEQRWNRPNWCAVEFNILYRWHSLVPDAIGEGPDLIAAADWRNNNPLILSAGLENLLAFCSKQRSGKIGLFNTPTFLVDRSTPDWPSVQERTVTLSRQARLRSFNDYRAAYGLHRYTSFDQLTQHQITRERLRALYPTVDDVEWYVGIFAEDYPDYLMMGELMTTMVANDAFTQALTNPLLARNVFTDATFTAPGMKVINNTKSIQDIVARNARTPANVYVNFECPAVP
jgi:prostaglandin-endoperoxide synthase 2